MSTRLVIWASAVENFSERHGIHTIKNANLSMYADDHQIYAAGCNLDEVEKTLNREGDRLKAEDRNGPSLESFRRHIRKRDLARLMENNCEGCLLFAPKVLFTTKSQSYFYRSSTDIVLVY